jgi:hypothetical protein
LRSMAHLLRVNRPGDVLEASFQLRLHHKRYGANHAREGADFAPVGFDERRQRRSVRGRVPRAWRVLAGGGRRTGTSGGRQGRLVAR